MSSFCSGFVTIVGRPNVGKSTLLNALVQEKISIISNKPQTTRNKIQCIVTGEDYQAVFIDTPGIHNPNTKLGEYMVKSAVSTFNEVDLVLMLVEPKHKIHTLDLEVIKHLNGVTTPVILVINKIDTLPKDELLKVMDNYREAYSFAEIVPISAIRSENLDTLMNCIKTYFSPGPQYFPEDMITDQPERQIVAEIIREKALWVLQEEVPHGLAIEINEMKPREGQNLIFIDATIHCEKASHKGIIIGKNGATLKDIGTKARGDISRLLGSKVYLELWVKVKKDWRNNDFLLKNFGYDKKQI